MRLSEGGMSELVMTWLEGRVAMTLDQLIDDASILFVALGDAAADIAQSRRPESSRA